MKGILIASLLSMGLGGCMTTQDAVTEGVTTGVATGLASRLPAALGIPAAAVTSGVVAGAMHSGARATAVPDQGSMPDTPQCRAYLRYIKSVGPMGTVRPMIVRYNACLNSAPNHPTSRRLRCGPGKYYGYFDNRRICGVP